VDLVLIRHPTVAVDAGVCYGRSDVALIDDARDSVETLAARLVNLAVPSPVLMLTSPLTRCASVAHALATRSGCELRVDARLQEMDFGTWEQQRWDAIDRALLDEWAANLHHARAHGGESVAQFVARVRGGFDDVQSHADGSCIHAVAHAGVIRVLASLALDVPLEQCLSWSIDFAGVVWLRRSDVSKPWKLVRWNA
jgi:alpha-ribazole phosphatase